MTGIAADHPEHGVRSIPTFTPEEMSAHRQKTVVSIAERMQLSLSEAERRDIEAIIAATGSLAPQDEVIELFSEGTLSKGMLTFFLPWIWRDKPDACTVPNTLWREMFDQVEYTEDSVVTARPRRTVRAYRGATEENREGLSWTLDRAQAEYFARSRQAPGVYSARVWVTHIPAKRMYARYMEGWEKEIVADVRSLDIFPIEEEARLPRLRRWQWWR